MNDCIFCKIAKGEIPALKIYEDSDFIGFLDVNPRFIGHALVIPKKHAETILELDDEQTEHMFKIVQKIAKEITETLGAKGFNIGNNNGQIAGQAVPHAHIHILPRYDTDEHHAGFEAAFKPSEDAKKELETTVKKIGTISSIEKKSTMQTPPEPKKEIQTSKDDFVFVGDDDVMSKFDG